MTEPARGRESRGLSLEIKLPLLITGVIAAVAIGIAAASYGEVRRSAKVALYARLNAIADLAEAAGGALDQRLAGLRRVASDPAIVSFLRGDTSALAAAQEALDTLPDPAGPTGPRLWSADRQIVLGAPPLNQPEPGGGVGEGATAVPDSGGVGPLFLSGDSAFFWTAVPVEDRGERLGWVAVLSQARGGNVNTVRSLLGEDVEVRYADASTGLWLSMGADPETPPPEWPFQGEAEITLDGATWHAVATRIPETSIHLVALAPESSLGARPRAFLRAIMLAALGLLVLGALVAWLVSRSVTRPLRQLEIASAAMAAGHYDQRVDLDRDDELGALAATFTHMASQVRDARKELEHQYGEARALAAELAHTNLILEQAIATAERSRIEAQQASRAKSDFLATMSHEIRTPINAMIGYTDLLDLGIAGTLNDKQRDQLARIRASGRHLIGLVDEVLDLAGVESGRMRLEPQDGRIDEAVRTAVAIVQPQAFAKKIDLSVVNRDGDGTPYRGDPRRVEQILVNLLTNAVKFTPNGGRIQVECGPAFDDGTAWSEVVVEDSGPGVEPEMHERIFEPFVQVESGYTRPHGGVGLGLAISRRLARMMGGDITVESEPGSGARFRVRLPTAAEEPQPAATG